MSDLNVFGAEMQRRARGLDAALSRGVRKALLAVETEASKLLSGSASAEPGTYPVPIRRGTLRRSLGVRQLNAASGLVFNRAKYARAIHEGFTPYGNKKAKRVAARPFLADAVEKADPKEYVFQALRQAVLG